MRSRVIGLVSVLFIGSLSIVQSTLNVSAQSLPLPTKTLFITNLPTKTPFVIEPPTETDRPTDRPTKTLFPAMTATPSPSATKMPVSTVERTRGPLPTERVDDQPLATAIPTVSITPPISARPTASNPTPTADRSSAVLARESSDTPSLKPVDHISDDHSASVAPILIPPTTIDLTGVVIALAGLGLSVWLGLWQHRRALVQNFNAWAKADLLLRSETERLAHRDRHVVDDDWVIRLLNQAALAATGEALGIDQIDRVLHEPIPAIVGLGRHFERVVFTPVPPAVITRLVKRHALLDLFGDSLHGVRQYSIDALNCALFMTDDLATAWAYLCDRNHSSPTAMPVPHSDRWSITIVPSQPARRAAGALYRLVIGRR